MIERIMRFVIRIRKFEVRKFGVRNIQTISNTIDYIQNKEIHTVTNIIDYIRNTKIHTRDHTMDV